MSDSNQQPISQLPAQEELANLFQSLNFIRGSMNNLETQLKQFPALLSPPGESPTATDQSDIVPSSQSDTPNAQSPPQVPIEIEITNETSNVDRVSRRDQTWRTQPPSRESSRGHTDDEFYTISRCRSETPEEVIPKFLKRERPPEFDAKKMTPPQYLEKLKEYIENQQIKSDKFKIACAKRGLERNHDQALHRISRYVQTFSEFEFLFLKEFWSTNDKIKQKEKIFKEKFHSLIKDESIYEFYRRTLDQVEKYYPEITLEELKLKFSDQVPDMLRLFIQNPSITDLEALNNLMKTMGDLSLDFMANSNQKNDRSRRQSPDSQSHEKDFNKRENKNYTLSKDYRQRPYNSRGNQKPHGQAHRVNVIQEVESTEKNSCRGNNSHYRGNSSQYKMNNQGGYRGREKPYQRNYNQQGRISNIQNDIDAKLNSFQQNIAKLIDEKFKSFGKHLQTDCELGGTEN
jgi:hypothetical protein